MSGLEQEPTLETPRVPRQNNNLAVEEMVSNTILPSMVAGYDPARYRVVVAGDSTRMDVTSVTPGIGDPYWEGL
jgi:hypothetical protein